MHPNVLQSNRQGLGLLCVLKPVSKLIMPWFPGSYAQLFNLTTHACASFLDLHCYGRDLTEEQDGNIVIYLFS